MPLGAYNDKPSTKQMLYEQYRSLRDKQQIFQCNKTLTLNLQAFGKTIVQFLWFRKPRLCKGLNNNELFLIEIL